MIHNRRSAAPAALATVLLSVTLLTLGSTAGAAIRAGSSCARSQAGKVTSGLVCTKSGSSYRWVKRTTSNTSRSTSAPTAPPPPVTNALMASIDVASIVFGAAPSTNGLTVTLTCTGLGGAERTLTRSLSFAASNSTSSTEFLLGAPTTENPTGSSCNGQVAVKGLSPTSLQILINGRPTDAITTSSNTSSIGTFTADAAFTVTVIQYFAGSPVTVPPATSQTVSTISGAPTTTTIAPSPATSTTRVTATTATTVPTQTTQPTPIPGQVPTVNVSIVGTAPASVTGYQLAITCTDIVIGGSILPVAQATNSIGRLGGPTSLNFAPQPNTTCQVGVTTLSTSPVSTGTITVVSNGVTRASSVANVSGTAFPYPAATPISVTVTY